jgi:hypothetical protein
MVGELDYGGDVKVFVLVFFKLVDEGGGVIGDVFCYVVFHKARNVRVVRPSSRASMVNHTAVLLVLP